MSFFACDSLTSKFIRKIIFACDSLTRYQHDVTEESFAAFIPV